MFVRRRCCTRCRTRARRRCCTRVQGRRHTRAILFFGYLFATLSRKLFLKTIADLMTVIFVALTNGLQKQFIGEHFSLQTSRARLIHDGAIIGIEIRKRRSLFVGQDPFFMGVGVIGRTKWTQRLRLKLSEVCIGITSTIISQCRLPTDAFCAAFSQGKCCIVRDFLTGSLNIRQIELVWSIGWICPTNAQGTTIGSWFIVGTTTLGSQEIVVSTTQIKGVVHCFYCPSLAVSRWSIGF